MKPYIDSSGYYALAENPKYRFYYGDLETDRTTGDWKFTVDKNGKRVFELTNAELLNLVDTDTQSPKDMLLTGILAYLSKWSTESDLADEEKQQVSMCSW